MINIPPMSLRFKSNEAETLVVIPYGRNFK